MIERPTTLLQAQFLVRHGPTLPRVFGGYCSRGYLKEQPDENSLAKGKTGPR